MHGLRYIPRHSRRIDISCAEPGPFFNSPKTVASGVSSLGQRRVLPSCYIFRKNLHRLFPQKIWWKGQKGKTREDFDGQSNKGTETPLVSRLLLVSTEVRGRTGILFMYKTLSFKYAAVWGSGIIIQKLPGKNLWCVFIIKKCMQKMLGYWLYLQQPTKIFGYTTKIFFRYCWRTFWYEDRKSGHNEI